MTVTELLVGDLQALSSHTQEELHMISLGIELKLDGTKTDRER